MGCWAWGDRIFWNYGLGYGEADLQQAFEAAISEGITFFDTAEIYGFGKSEKLLAKFMAGSKGEVVIASKIFPYPWRLSAWFLKGALRRSLKRLRQPAIQLYQVHWPYAPVSIEAWMNAMADAVEAGLIKQIGVSNYNPQQTERAFRALERRGLHLASNQVSYSLLQRGPERNGLMQLCKDLKVTVIAYSPLAQGLLTGKYSPQNPPTGARGLRTSKSALAEIRPLLDEMIKIGIRHGNKTAAQVALNWCVCKDTLAIPGAKNARQAKENAGALGWSLTEAEVAKLDELTV
jgi:aryl-alcohol dehydrogenase-like predicted oxidoreductase